MRFAKITQHIVKQQGFTLIELMITVAIIGILAAIALPSYQNAVMKSRRVSAITTLQDMASREERYFTSQNSYTSSVATLGYPAGAAVAAPSASSHYYDVSVTLNATDYTLQAIPVAGSSQANDTDCATFTYSSTGLRGVTGTGTIADCWKS